MIQGVAREYHETLGKLEDKHAEWLCNHTLEGIPASRQRYHVFGADVLVLDDFSCRFLEFNAYPALHGYDERNTNFHRDRVSSMMRVLGYRLDRDETQDPASAPDIVKPPEETSKRAGEKTTPAWQMVSAALPPPSSAEQRLIMAQQRLAYVAFAEGWADFNPASPTRQVQLLGLPYVHSHTVGKSPRHIALEVVYFASKTLPWSTGVRAAEQGWAWRDAQKPC